MRLARRVVLLGIAGLVVASIGSARAAAACNPALAPSPQWLSEGPPNDTDAAINLRSLGVSRAKVIFVDFSDAPAGTLTPAGITAGWMTSGVRWLRTSSYGKFNVQLDPHPTWIRMPRPSASYGFPGVGYDLHKVYIADALAAADATADFSQADVVYIVPAPGAAIPQSPTFRGLPVEFPLDGRNMHRVVTFGMDGYRFGRTTLPHETGHLLGLPDLYASGGTDLHRYVGSWDVMGNIFQPTDYFAWHRLKLGWLTPGQFTCATSTGTTTATLTPLGGTGGKKAIFVKTGPYTALIAENRQRVGNDRGICDAGILVYKVDSRIETMHGPIKVLTGTLGHGCGYGSRSDAPLHVGQRATIGGTTVVVTGKVGLSLTVRIIRR